LKVNKCNKEKSVPLASTASDQKVIPNTFTCLENSKLNKSSGIALPKQK
jgi:hypothetical protein